MKLQRRDFLKLGIAHTIVGFYPKGMAAQSVPFNQKSSGPSILQGATDETRTQFSILFQTATNLEIFVTDQSDSKIWAPDSFQVIEQPGHPQKITKVTFSSLNPKETYFLSIQDKQSFKTIDRRQFQTLDLSAPDFRFAICSCMDEAQHQADIWKDLVSKKPQMLFFVGDSVYADRGAPASGANPSHLWSRFCDARNTLDIFFSPRLIPILAVWDDHDFGLNDSNSENYPFVEASQKNFLSFFAQEESHCEFLKRGPGISSALRFKNQLVILADDRSYRKPRGSKDRYAHWGQEQENWMLSLIEQTRGPSWIMNGSQVFPSVLWKESVSGEHKAQFKGFLNELSKRDSKVIFASGDVHYSEISRIETEAIGYETFEVTSSSMHSKSFPGFPDIVPNDRRIASTGSRNYVLVGSTPRENGADLTVTSYSSSGNKLFQKALRIG